MHGAFDSSFSKQNNGWNLGCFSPFFEDGHSERGFRFWIMVSADVHVGVKFCYPLAELLVKKSVKIANHLSLSFNIGQRVRTT